MSKADKLIGSFPKNEAIDEYDEIGILKLVKDSTREIIISTNTKIDNKWKILFKFLILSENDIMLIEIVKPQNK